jgi:hypothetical protein
MGLMAQAVGAEQLLYGSDRAVVERGDLGMPAALDWDAIAQGERPRARDPNPHPGRVMGATALPAFAPALPADAIARPRGRDLSAAELDVFVAALAERPEIWIDLVKHDAVNKREVALATRAAHTVGVPAAPPCLLHGGAPSVRRNPV